MKHRICIITGSRAEYDLLKPLIELFHHDKDYQLQLIATCMHLSPEFGLTVNVIEEDQFPLADKIEMLLSADTSCAISKSTGMGIISFADSLRRLNPTMLIVLGDRFETLSAVIPAFMMKIPIIHLHGGETTQGAYDEGIRHAISKMSYLHFTSTAEYRRRVIQLGEHPERVFNVGAIGVENFKKVKVFTKSELEQQLQFNFQKKNILVTFHPVTLESTSSQQLFTNLLTVLNEYKDLGIIFTKANADTDGRIINSMIDEFVRQHATTSTAFTTLGHVKYFNTLLHVNAMVGNSSSGIIEAPSCKVGTINIGDRQTGRIKAPSIIDCDYDVVSIEKAFTKIFSADFQSSLKNVTNPYDGGHTSKKIFDIIKQYAFNPAQLKKNFYDVAFQA